MNSTIGWALAALALVVGYLQWGWPGVVLAITCTVFWLLLQFSRALRVMRQAAGAPVGSVASAVMLHAKLRPGMRLLEVIPLAGSLGQRGADVPPDPAHPTKQGNAQESGVAAGAHEVFVWEDASQTSVRLEFSRGRLQRWTLQRPGDFKSEPPSSPSSPDGPNGPDGPGPGGPPAAQAGAQHPA